MSRKNEDPAWKEKFLSEVTEDFEVLGERNDDWEHFKENVEYEGFLVRRKIK